MKRRPIFYVASGWLLVALVFTAQQLVVESRAPTGAPPFLIIARTALFNGLWAALTLAVLWLVNRYPPGGGRRLRFIALHFVACLAAVTVQLVAYTELSAALRIEQPVNVGSVLAASFLTGLFIYVMLLVVILLIEQARKAREREATQSKLEARLAETRVMMLRTQLQPHFLFNTLNTIAALIPDDPRTAEHMVARLGDLLRISLANDRGPTVSLGEDLAALDAYLAIEALRLGARLRIVREITPDTLSVRVPDLLLQPIAENAIRHGLAVTPAGGTLRISARRDGALLRLTVEDDGAGAVAGEMIERIGLGNTRERLRLLAGDTAECGVTVRTAPGAGFAVIAILPWRVT